MSGKIFKLVSNYEKEIYIGCSKEKYLSNVLGAYRKNYQSFLRDERGYTPKFGIVRHKDCKIIVLEEGLDDKNMRTRLLAHREENKDIIIGSHKIRKPRTHQFNINELSKCNTLYKQQKCKTDMRYYKVTCDFISLYNSLY